MKLAVRIIPILLLLAVLIAWGFAYYHWGSDCSSADDPEWCEERRDPRF